MPFKSSIFKSECRDLGKDNYLHFINIPALDEHVISHIDACVVSICEGDSHTDVATIKQRLKSFLTPKRGTTTEMGAIAEFFGHLYLTEIGFSQEFLFLNLEEGSIKKGFDGYYSREDESWIYESKSGSITSKGSAHESKVTLAYEDLKEKISGNPANNPWQNAYNHASHCDVGSDANLKKSLKNLANDFTRGKRQDISLFNIIPGSTLFLDQAWSDIDANDLAPKLIKQIETFSFKKIHIVCVNKASVNLFWDYLEN